MSTVSIDHIAMPTANAERLIEFYKRIGFTINDEDEWRAGQSNAFSIQVGDSKINVHPEGYTASLRGPTAVPGCADICFVWDGTADECKDMLDEAGVEIISGPRPAARRAEAQGCRQPVCPRPGRKSARMDGLSIISTPAGCYRLNEMESEALTSASVKVETRRV